MENYFVIRFDEKNDVAQVIDNFTCESANLFERIVLLAWNEHNYKQGDIIYRVEKIGFLNFPKVVELKKLRE